MHLFPVCDLHCDLLFYLHNGEKRSAYDLAPRCSIPQLKKGHVALQTLAIYTETGPGSARSAQKQFDLFKALPALHPQELARLGTGPKEAIQIVLAIENASGILEEGEPFEKGIERVTKFQKEGGPILYVSLTWNGENRWGGGNETRVGLKREGELLLDFLSAHNIAIDLSHTSDPLAHDILNYIEKHSLPLIPIASHSNFRAITHVPRNLPDEIAKEIFRKGGIIGINFIRPFIGTNPTDFLRHIEHGLSLGGEEHLCLGADFFDDGDLESLTHLKPFFFPGFDEASCYPRFLALLGQQFSEKQLQRIASQNFYSFLKSRKLPLKT